ncbi:MAG TPA: hypothetical protein VGE08_00815 [Steroidobacter sp.]|uniref:hypothetical protein n=1 Tax=Steroidobacter sp. TaxID=1978227 RepID=UPI002EDB2F1E
MIRLARKLLMVSGTLILCVGFAACGGGSSGAGTPPPTSSSPPSDPLPPTDDPSTVQGIATPSSVSVVTATNAD